MQHGDEMSKRRTLQSLRHVCGGQRSHMTNDAGQWNQVSAAEALNTRRCRAAHGTHSQPSWSWPTQADNYSPWRMLAPTPSDNIAPHTPPHGFGKATIPKAHAPLPLRPTAHKGQSARTVKYQPCQEDWRAGRIPNRSPPTMGFPGHPVTHTTLRTRCGLLVGIEGVQRGNADVGRNAARGVGQQLRRRRYPRCFMSAGCL